MRLDAMAGIEEKLALAMIDRFGQDTRSMALDMTNFATLIDIGNATAPVAQRGKAKQKRADLRLVGLGLVAIRAGDPAALAPRIGNAEDGGLRCRAELKSKLRPPRRHRPGLRRLRTGQRLHGPACPP